MYIRASHGLGQVSGKKPEIRIYLRDRGTADQPSYDEGAVRTCLESMFCEVCERPDSTVKFARVFWLSNKFPQKMFCPFLQPHDVIVYILEKHKQSIIKKVYNVTPAAKFAGSSYNGDKGWISEVYLDSEVNKSARGLTYMIYHELLHNKCEKGDSLHFICDAGTTHIASAKHTTEGILRTTFSECDKKLMAPVLGKDVLQFCA